MVYLFIDRRGVRGALQKGDDGDSHTHVLCRGVGVSGGGGCPRPPLAVPTTGRGCPMYCLRLLLVVGTNVVFYF